MKSTLLLLLAPLAVLAAPAEVAERQADTSIDTLIKAKSKIYYGTCTDQNRLTTGKSADVIIADFGQVGPPSLFCPLIDCIVFSGVI
jgi:endo-1,4-beta-xylanase